MKISRLKIAGKEGYGRKRKLQPTEIFEEKIKNFRNTINHKYAKIIIREAIKHKCGIIVMEDLHKDYQKANDFSRWMNGN